MLAQDLVNAHQNAMEQESEQRKQRVKMFLDFIEICYPDREYITVGFVSDGELVFCANAEQCDDGDYMVDIDCEPEEHMAVVVVP